MCTFTYYNIHTQTLTTAQQELPVLEEEEDAEEQQSHDKDETPPTDNKETAEQVETSEDQSRDQMENKLTNQSNGSALTEFLSNEVACASSRHKASVQLPPYGLPCLRELLRFLISIINSTDR